MLRDARSVVPEGPDESSPAIYCWERNQRGSRPVRDDRTLTTDFGLKCHALSSLTEGVGLCTMDERSAIAAAKPDRPC
jgi:hypothetical protein